MYAGGIDFTVTNPGKESFLQDFQRVRSGSFIPALIELRFIS